MQTRALLLGAIVASVSDCMSTGKYDAAITDAATARASLEAARGQTARLAAEKATAEQTLSNEAAQAKQATDTSRAETAACRKELDDSTAIHRELQAELSRLGKNAEQLLAAKGALASSLDQAKARLEELRRAQAAAETRSALFRQLALKLKRMVDAGELQIQLRSGRMVLVLPNDVLFESGKADIKSRGQDTLAQIAAALATVQGRHFQVAGHTDNEPIRFSGFASNWQLSTQRALEVVNFLVKSGMQPGALSAAGYSEFDPVTNNDTAAGKAQNRRIEITLQPNIDEFVAVPGQG